MARAERRMSFDVQPLSDSLKDSGMTLADMIRFMTPPLDSRKHKGQRGRIGVVGGSSEYVGAPYFAAITALRVGADLSYVFCPKESAAVIKAYSPDLIVHPLLEDNGIDDICNKWLEKLHSVIIGPGLGRRPHTVNHLKKLLTKAKQLNIPIILDADSLWFLTENDGVREAIANYHRAVITPNASEFTRIYQKVTQREMPISAVKGAYYLAAALGNVTVIRKGPTDAISNGHEVLECTEEGSAVRCGGQGDILSGACGLYAHWAMEAHKYTQSGGPKNPIFDKAGPMVCAAYAACVLTRRCNYVTFHHIKHGAPLRDSMTTSDMVEMLHVAKQQLQPISRLTSPVPNS